MKAKTSLDTKLMFEQACAFVDCAEFTESERYRIYPRTKSHGFVDISLSAVACEIFIKCLIIHKGGTYKNQHVLKDLWNIFRGVDQNEADKIEAALMSWFGSADTTQFQQMISDASDAFVQWRYVFDYGKDDGVKVNPQFLRGFRTALRDVCCQEIEGKSWNEYIKM